MKRVVITGMGAVTPLGNDVETFWNNILKGESGADTITHFNPEKFKVQFAAEVKTSHRKNIWTGTKSNEVTFSHNTPFMQPLRRWKIPD